MSDLFSETKCHFLQRLPEHSQFEELIGSRFEKVIILRDRRLAKDKALSSWLKRDAVQVDLKGGESLKDLARFPNEVARILKKAEPFSARHGLVIGVGGGTVGDFAGFFASVYKRGVPLVHVPTTLLAAMDSAHGGKTALNLGTYKNQIGTFHPAVAVLVVKRLLEGLPLTQIKSAAGELAKMIFIAGGEWFESCAEAKLYEFETIWNQIPKAIEVKAHIVQKDPRETSGERQVLNLGHTLGHVLEAHYGLLHGEAVGLGLEFALEWSHHRGLLTARDRDRMLRLLLEAAGVVGRKVFMRRHRPMRDRDLLRILERDKKLDRAGQITFIFLEALGRPVRMQIPLPSLVTEAMRQGWLYRR